MPARDAIADVHRRIEPLLKKREQLQTEMVRLESQIKTLLASFAQHPPELATRGSVRRGVTPPQRAASSPRPPGPSKASLSPKAGTKHGMLKENILAALARAGARGRSISELAAELGILKAHVQAWFSGTGKKVRGLQKVGPAHWRYVRGA